MFSAFAVIDAAESKDLEMLQGIFNVGVTFYIIKELSD